MHLPPLIRAILIRRVNRFVFEIELDSGKKTYAHTNNTGSMRSCSSPGSICYVEPKRTGKLPYRLWLVQTESALVGVNTSVPQRIVAEAIEQRKLLPFAGYSLCGREPRFASGRLDLLLCGKQKVFIETKNVTLQEDGIFYFPDARTARGRKHLHELIHIVQSGSRAAILFVIQRNDGKVFRPADHIDPEFGRALRFAVSKGVEIYAYTALVSLDKIELAGAIDIQL